jgi:hypothetical protein
MKLPVRYTPVIKQREGQLYTPFERDYADMEPKATGKYVAYEEYITVMREVAKMACPNPWPVSHTDCLQDDCIVCKAKELIDLEDRHSKLRGYKK